MTKKFIIDKLSTLKVINEETLIKYVDFCFNKNLGTVYKENNYSKSSLHHILPKSLFPEYSNLKENIWNGSHLLYADHYYAHWLLTEAIDDYSQSHAFLAMHNKDSKNGRVQENELFSPDVIQQKIEGIKYKRRDFDNTIIETEFGLITNKQLANIKSSITKNDKAWKNTIGKEKIEKFKIDVLTEYIDDLGNITTKSKEISLKSAKTMSKIIKINGEETTIYKQSAIKRQNTKNKEFINADNEVTNINKETGKKLSKILNSKYFTGDSIETSISIERGKKCSLTKNKIIIDSDGNETTSAKKSILKTLKTRSKIFLDSDGNETNIDKENGKKIKQRYEESSKRYVVKNAITGEIFDNMLLRDIRKLSVYLFNKTESDYLGLKQETQTRFKNNNKEFLIGLYVVK